MMQQYTAERKEAVLKKLLAPNAPPVSVIAKEEKISPASLFNWRKTAIAGGEKMPDKETPAESWSADEKFEVVLECASLNATELAEYCRRRGVFEEQVKQWKKACIKANETPSKAQLKREQLESRAEQKTIKRLEKELIRKERALAETAALLVLRKKANAIWGSGEDE